MTDPTLQDTLRALAWLDDHLDDLWHVVEHGRQAPRRSTPPVSTPGSRPPINVDALDLHTDLLMRADLLHEAVAQTVGQDRLTSAASVGESPARFLGYVLELLSDAVTIDPGFLAECAWVDPMRLAVAVLLGEVVEGTALDAMCPFCLGFGPSCPQGGARTLVFRRIARRAGLAVTEGDDGTEMVIVCESGTCTPFAAEVSLWVRGMPAWPWSEWEWLAERLDRLRGA